MVGERNGRPESKNLFQNEKQMYSFGVIFFLIAFFTKNCSVKRHSKKENLAPGMLCRMNITI